MQERVARLRAWPELISEGDDLLAHANELSDESVMLALGEAAALANDATRLQTILAGVLARRSARDLGHNGLSATHGHASPASLIQSITGGSKADAVRHVRVGSLLFEESSTDATPDDAADSAVPTDTPPATPWHEPLRRALLEGTLTTEQQDAIRRGLGDPIDERAWMIAAEQLIDEAPTMPVEELGKRARIVRDLLDPAGAEERGLRRYEQRAFKPWTDQDGQHHARVTFADEDALWIRALTNAALKPRRGGPRFIADDERAAADALVTDPRTNTQLEYDLIIDVLRAGSLAKTADVFGTRQPGVRVIVVKDAIGARDALGRMLAVGHSQDGGDALPGSVIDRNLCTHGSREITTDHQGNPLNLGRERRLFSPAQRLTLAARDGGCIWPECDKPASYTEAHHIDQYVADGGRTDVDRGVLLCRYHHMLLHNRGWRITREDHGPFILHRPPGDGPPATLTSKAPWKWTWDPPPLDPYRASWRDPHRSSWRESA